MQGLVFSEDPRESRIATLLALLNSMQGCTRIPNFAYRKPSKVYTFNMLNLH